MSTTRKYTDRALVNVKVHPALREYILSINSGSDILMPLKDSRLWGLVKMHLETIPAGYKPTSLSGADECIRIALYRSGKPSYSFPSKDVVTVHTMYRDYLSDSGQKAVARHLMQSFKQTFRAYMTGALSNNPELEIQDAIDEFCSDYRIETEKITVEMLRKDWYRYRLRCSAASGTSVPVENADL